MKFSKQIQNKLKNLPYKPGCYIFRNKKKKILYIGKAVNLRNRVRSYFTKYKQIDPKIQLMIDQISDLEIIITDTEVEALILETNLIKKYKPKYNRLMKDDKNYSWIKITTKEDFPKINLVRKKLKDKNDYFGPFPNILQVRNLLKRLRHIFPYRSCTRIIEIRKDKNNNKYVFSSDKKPCLYLHLGLCEAPCTTKLSKSDYRKNINYIKKFLRGKKNYVLEDMKKQMKHNSKLKIFEKAALIRDKINELEYVTQWIKIGKDVDEIMYAKSKDEKIQKAIIQLFKKLNIPKQNDEEIRIECYDISNISGKNATGSMVVFINGKASKSSYRKFKIKTKDTPDDYEMMREVFFRRFNLKEHKERNFDESFADIPDLIIVDGGKGQLTASKKILENLKLEIPIIGLAKKKEEIFKIDNTKVKNIKLSNKTAASYLIQQIRDEAHRFAIKYHRKLRSKTQIQSVLDQIPGVGETTKKRLLKAFGNTENIKKASFEELQGIVKNRKTVDNIKKIL